MTATVLQLSDTHLTASPADRVHDLDPAARLDTVVSAWLALGRRADAVVLTGDISDDASRRGCRRAADAIAPIRAEVLGVAGNHDRGPDVAGVFGPRRTLEVGGWRIVGLDSEREGHVEGAVDPAGVLADLDRHDDRPTVLAVHHPPAGPSTHPWFQLGGAGELLEGLARRPHVRMVVSGHLHQPFELRAGPLHLLGAPSTLYSLRHHGDGWAADASVPTGARVLHLEDDGSWATELLVA